MKVYESIWRLFKVYEGIWKYMEVYKVYLDILKKSSSALPSRLSDLIRPYSILFWVILFDFALICVILLHFVLFWYYSTLFDLVLTLFDFIRSYFELIRPYFDLIRSYSGTNKTKKGSR